MISDEPYAAWARVAALFHPVPPARPGVHPTAVVAAGTAADAPGADAATTGTQYGALLAADEEGGEVQRYTEVIGPIPSARRQSNTMTPGAVRAMYATAASSPISPDEKTNRRLTRDAQDVLAERDVAGMQGSAEGG